MVVVASGGYCVTVLLVLSERDVPCMVVVASGIRVHP